MRDWESERKRGGGGEGKEMKREENRREGKEVVSKERKHFQMPERRNYKRSDKTNNNPGLIWDPCKKPIHWNEGSLLE